MVAGKAVKYIADHWQGRQGLAWSFWVNFVLVRALIFLGQDRLSPAKDSDYSAHNTLVLSLAIFFHGICFVWQVVGVVRAGEAYIRASGVMAYVWGMQLGAIMAFWLTVTYAFGAWQMTLPAPKDLFSPAKVEAERAGKYSFVASADGAKLIFSGSIELGTSKQLAKQLKQTPSLQTIVLSSPGGNIYEARGLSKLIHENGLNTLVETQCTSACTTVFIGGITRMLMPDARLGFHQYRVDANYDVLNSDVAAEQEHDRMLYASAHVKPWFLKRMYESGSDGMWFPEFEELLDAGVITHIYESSTVPRR